MLHSGMNRRKTGGGYSTRLPTNDIPRAKSRAIKDTVGGYGRNEEMRWRHVYAIVERETRGRINNSLIRIQETGML